MEWSGVKMQRILCVLLVSMSIDSVCGQCSSAPPTINNATTNIQGSPPYPEATEATYSCPQGYNIQGTFSTTCNGGSWTLPSFQCIQILCPLFGPPSNGVIHNNPDYTIGSTIQFSCNDGFDITGQATFMCGNDGQWSPTLLPTCTAKDCGQLSPIANAETFQPTPENGENHYGAEVRVTCNDGFILNGSPTVTCGANGSWSKSPTCDTITCPPYPGLNSSCIAESLFVSNNLYMVCLDGPEYSVTETGGTSATCSASGWSDTELACYCDCKMSTDNGATYEGLINGFLKHDNSLVWDCNRCYEKAVQETIFCRDGKLVVTPTFVIANQSGLCSPTATCTSDTTSANDNPTSPANYDQTTPSNNSNSGNRFNTTYSVVVSIYTVFLLPLLYLHIFLTSSS